MLLCFVTEKFHFFVIFFFYDAKVGVESAFYLNEPLYYGSHPSYQKAVRQACGLIFGVYQSA